MDLSLSYIKRKIAHVLKKSPYNVAKKLIKEGYREFEKSGVTPHESYMAIINLFCMSNGKFNEEFHKKIKGLHPAHLVPNKVKGLLGNLDKEDFNKINNELNDDGYSIFTNKLTQDQCDAIYKYALTLQANVPGQTNRIFYDPSNPLSEIYRLSSNDVINSIDIQNLIMDPTLINIARNYLGCEPIFDFPAMWWSTSFSKEASSEAAQVYHFDMDRIKWLKIFFYINDVTPENGPHRYIKGSHKVGTKPADILSKGYVRVSDEELSKHYPAESFIQLCGVAGTIFAGDTKCWHKGTHLKNGHRLVLELQYTSSLYGANYPKIVAHNYDNKFKNFTVNNEVYSSNIELIDRSFN